jgi:hypothetical protein
MTASDWIPDRPIPAARGLDQPPAPGEGKVLDVEMDHVWRQYGDREKCCQACGEPVLLSESHVWARVSRENAIGTVYKKIVFCDRECWGGWSTSN